MLCDLKQIRISYPFVHAIHRRLHCDVILKYPHLLRDKSAMSSMLNWPQNSHIYIYVCVCVCVCVICLVIRPTKQLVFWPTNQLIFFIIISYIFQRWFHYIRILTSNTFWRLCGGPLVAYPSLSSSFRNYIVSMKTDPVTFYNTPS